MTRSLVQKWRQLEQRDRLEAKRITVILVLVLVCMAISLQAWSVAHKERLRAEELVKHLYDQQYRARNAATCTSCHMGVKL